MTDLLQGEAFHPPFYMLSHWRTPLSIPTFGFCRAKNGKILRSQKSAFAVKSALKRKKTAFCTFFTVFFVINHFFYLFIRFFVLLYGYKQRYCIK